MQTSHTSLTSQSSEGGFEPAATSCAREATNDTRRSVKAVGHAVTPLQGVLARDKFNLFILFAQAPIIAMLTYLVVDAKGQRDFPYFILALVALWFGTSVASREVIRNEAVYKPGTHGKSATLPYVGSKLFVLL